MPSDPIQPFPRVQTNPEVEKALMQVAMFSAGHEALKPTPVSRVRNPDGSAQGETLNERDTRVVTAGVMHLVELGLLVVPDDIWERLDDFLPMNRES